MDQMIGRRHFHGPFHDFALVVLGFQRNERVWLDELKVLHRADQGKRMSSVIRRAAVMRQRGPRIQGNTCSCENYSEQSFFHWRKPPVTRECGTIGLFMSMKIPAIVQPSPSIANRN